MEKLTSILVTIDPLADSRPVVAKAVTLARRFGARIELFLCDAELAYALQHAYDTSGAAQARQACLAKGRKYLEELRQSTIADDIPVSVDVSCESPLYEGIVRKVLQSCPDLVIKGAAGRHPLRRLTLDPNDWQLARTCPVPLMIVRSRPWGEPPRFAAAVDVSSQETASFTRAILHTAEYLSLGCRAGLDLLYSDSYAQDVEEHQRLTQTLRALAHDLKVPDGHVHLLEGEPEDTLPAFAAGKSYDVLVLGALTHRTGLTALIGTLTSRLVDALDADFVLVKPGTYVCPLMKPVATEVVKTSTSRSAS